MKQPARFFVVLMAVALILGGCLNPVSVLTNTRATPAVDGGHARQLPGPTTQSPPAQPSATALPIDTSDLIRDPVTAADRTDEQLIDSADIPIADLRELAIRFKGVPATTPLKNCTTAPHYSLGDVAAFNVLNSDTMANTVVSATLIAETDQAYMWLDNRWLNHVNLNAFQQALQDFSDKILPRDHALFGQEESPGIDCDTHIHILNTSGDVMGANTGGYVSSVDRVTRQVRSDSNEKDMFYVNIEGSGGPSGNGADYYHGTMAHEFQHVIQENHDPNEDAWVSEGMSELAMFLNGSDDQYDAIAAQTPNIQLDSWPDGGVAGPDVYGTAFSFMLYFWDRYGDAGVQALAAEPANGLAGVQNVLNKIDPGKQADDLVADWLVARLLDDPAIDNGRFGYSKTDRAKVDPRQTIDQYPFSEEATIHQYAGDYTEFRGRRDVSIDFVGSTKAQMIAAKPHSGQYFMWSNRADVADLRLTHEFDLSSVKSATLNYWTWYDLEKDWDYAYLSVSEDGGQTWKLMKAPSMTDSNPTNANYGWGYTGKSGGGDQAAWIQQSVDLTPYAGKKIIVAFEVITDLAVNRPGLAIDDVAVPEINYQTDFEKDDGGWQSAGWLRTNNFVPQKYVVQLVSFGKNGQTEVSRLPVNDDNTAHWDIPLSQLQKAIVVVSPMAAKTTEVAHYNWSVQEK
jgi:immune inhibitor A